MRTISVVTLSMVTLGLVGTTLAVGADAPFTMLQKGKYLVDAGDCVACHTTIESKPFAGGRAIPTPFGTIYSANITPDKDTGIGSWSADDFYRAMHQGLDPRGQRLYPAFPYPYFTKMPREDVDAIRAYLMNLAPIANAPPRNTLTFPLNFRELMAGWDWMFFHPGELPVDAGKSTEWNRGAYLVEGPGHCGACHTAKNVAGADKTTQPLQGAPIQGWTAPRLVGDERTGLGRWSKDDIAEYLKTGRNRFSGATGLMAEVIVNSTSRLTDADLHAIATYLKDMPAKSEERSSAPDEAVMAAGKAIYDDTCAACHQSSGEGVPHMFPPLKGDAVAQQADPSTVVRVILEGAMTVTTRERPTPSAMPAFNWKLGDDEIAAVASYVRNAWGNNAPAVSVDTVTAMRKSIDQSKATAQTVGSGVKLHEPDRH
jgi:mono/diheme cytochrome c family protein